LTVPYRATRFGGSAATTTDRWALPLASTGSVINSAHGCGQTRCNNGVHHGVIVGGEPALCLGQDEDGVGDSSDVLLEQGGKAQSVIPAHAHHQMGGVRRQQTKPPDDVGDSVPRVGLGRPNPIGENGRDD
jgi:hypothetical protein